MSDSGQWAPPGGSPSPAPTPPSRAFPPPTPPTSAAPPAQAFPPPAGGAPFPPPAFPPPAPGSSYGPPVGQPTAGWAPPPKPGLIPLRPLTLGTLLGASFQVLRRNPKPMFGFSLLLTGLVFVITLVSMGVLAFVSISRLTTASGADAEAIAVGSTASMLLGFLVPAVFSIAVIAILQGIVALEVARGTLGEKLRLRGLWNAARGRIGALLGWSLLVTAVSIVAVLIIALIIVALVAFGGPAGIGLSILFAVLAALGSVAVALWLSTRLSLVPSALVLERLRLGQAVRRSWSLTTGYFWKTLGIILLVSVILSTASSIISTPFSFIMGLGVGLFSPTGDEESALVVVIVLYLLSIAISVVVGAISAVVQSATTALIYIDLRMRKEGLDLELARFVEARQAGDASVPDPYLVRRPEVPA